MFPFYNKAQAEFNWILILIAGIIIISSFVAFAIDYKVLSDRKLNTELSLSLDSQLNAFTSSGLTTEINPNGLDFFTSRFSCNSITMNNGEPINAENSIIFSSSSITTDRLLVWVDEFSLPYRISNIYYLSSPYIKYYILYDDSTSSLVNEILVALPKRDSSQFFNIKPVTQIDESEIESDISRERLREIRIVTFTDIDMPSLKAKTKIIRLSPNIQQGTAYYPDNNQLAGYIKKQLFLASIFSDNYSCNLDKLITKLGNMNNIHADKAAKLFFKTQSAKPGCNYQLFASAINSIDIKNLNSLLQFESRLLSQNTELNKKGCQDVF